MQYDNVHHGLLGVLLFYVGELSCGFLHVQFLLESAHARLEII